MKPCLGEPRRGWVKLTGDGADYIVYIMQGANIASPLLTAAIQYIINVALTLPAIIFLDRWGRRPPLVLGAFGMMTWLFISGAVQQYCGRANVGDTVTEANKEITWIVDDNPAASRAVVACSYLFVATFATSWGPTSWTYPAEIYPSKIRAKAVSLATATNWFCNMVLAFAVPPLLWNINYKMYYIFAAFNGCAFLHMFFLAPETKVSLLFLHTLCYRSTRLTTRFRDTPSRRWTTSSTRASPPGGPARRRAGSRTCRPRSRGARSRSRPTTRPTPSRLRRWPTRRLRQGVERCSESECVLTLLVREG